jgi:hypothetical protein
MPPRRLRFMAFFRADLLCALRVFNLCFNGRRCGCRAHVIYRLRAGLRPGVTRLFVGWLVGPRTTNRRQCVHCYCHAREFLG